MKARMSLLAGFASAMLLVGAGCTTTTSTTTTQSNGSGNQPTVEQPPENLESSTNEASEYNENGESGTLPSSTPSNAPSASSTNPSVGTVPSAPAKSEVNIQNFAFNPASIVVKKGTTVVWTNMDSMDHTVTADDSSFNSGKIANGKTYSFTFTKTGTYAYHCAIHPSMKGTVTVQ